MLNSNLNAHTGPPHFVDLHVNPGESVSIQLFDGNETILRGPATITMISQHTFPPIPMPVQVPPGHMIQQIVDENGTLRHIILSALNNNSGNSPSNAALMPQQQQQQPFPYCCCCCYSCTGTVSTSASAALAPPTLAPPPPPPPQVHHNILAFPTQATRRRLPSRTYSPSGKRAPQAFYNNNNIGKSPVRNKITSSVAVNPIEVVSKVTYPNSKNATSSDNKSYELNSNQVLVGKARVNHNDSCLTDSIHVNNTCNNKESNDGIRKRINDKDFSLMRQTITTKTAQPFSYTSLDLEQKDLSANNEIICSQSEDPKNSINNITDADIKINNEENNYDNENDKQVPELNILNIKNDDQIRDASSNKVNDILLCEESLYEFEEQDNNSTDLNEVDDQINEQNYKNSNTLYDKQTVSDNSNQLDQLEDKIWTNATTNNNTNTNQSNQQHNQNNQTINNQNNQNHKQLVSEQSLSQSQSMANKQLDCNESQLNDINISEENVSVTVTVTTSKAIEDTCEDNIVKTSQSQLQSQSLTAAQRSPKHLLPQLQLLNLTYTSLTANTVKLKWTYQQPHSLQDQLYAKHYVVEMLSNKIPVTTSMDVTQNSRIVYQGHSNNCRISHLSSQQQYSFRVRTTSEEHLVVSNILTITTPEQQPISNKYTKKSKQQLLQQQIQQQQHQIHQQQMMLQQQQQISNGSSSSCRLSDDEPVISSDQRCAIVILLLFTLFALIVAVLIQQLLTD